MLIFIKFTAKMPPLLDFLKYFYIENPSNQTEMRIFFSNF